MTEIKAEATVVVRLISLPFILPQVWQPETINDLPLLRITDALRVEGIGQLVGGAHRVRPNQSSCVVLWHVCSLKLGDEPLLCGVKYCSSECGMGVYEPAVCLHNSIHFQPWE